MSKSVTVKFIGMFSDFCYWPYFTDTAYGFYWLKGALMKLVMISIICFILFLCFKFMYVKTFLNIIKNH